ncbi:MAG: TetR/AcrR family transcriptional regulator C-terminal domain-containing protein [Steroidobacteraceae bacterium]
MARPRLSSRAKARHPPRRPRGRPPADLGEQRLQHLYQVAFWHFVVNGVENANINAIAREAGVARQMIHSRFGTKLGFAKVVLDKVIIAADGAAEAVQFDDSADPHRPQDVLETAANRLLETLVTSEALRVTRALFGGLHRDQRLIKIYAEYLGRAETSIASYLARAARVHKVRLDTMFAARTYLGLITGLYTPEMLGIRSMCDQERRHLVTRTVRVFLRGIGLTRP